MESGHVRFGKLQALVICPWASLGPHASPGVFGKSRCPGSSARWTTPNCEKPHDAPSRCLRLAHCLSRGEAASVAGEAQACIRLPYVYTRKMPSRHADGGIGAPGPFPASSSTPARRSTPTCTALPTSFRSPPLTLGDHGCTRHKTGPRILDAAAVDCPRGL